MKNTRNFFVSKVLPLVLIAVMALTVVSCGTKTEPETGVEKTFTFEAYDLDGTQLYSGEITTTAATVGAALLEKELIAGEDSTYGLYVKIVCGVEAVYEKDTTYWAFYVGDGYAMSGVDTTDIEDGATYSFRRSK